MKITIFMFLTCVSGCVTVDQDGPGHNPECESLCEVQLSCDPEGWPIKFEDCVQGCQDTNVLWSEHDNPECLQAQREVNACVGSLTCGEYWDWLGEPEGYPCHEQDSRMKEACG